MPDHPQVLVPVKAQVDSDLAPLITVLNQLDGVWTEHSCQGEYEDPEEYGDPDDAPRWAYVSLCHADPQGLNAPRWHLQVVNACLHTLGIGAFTYELSFTKGGTWRGCLRFPPTHINTLVALFTEMRDQEHPTQGA